MINDWASFCCFTAELDEAQTCQPLTQYIYSAVFKKHKQNIYIQYVTTNWQWKAKYMQPGNKDNLLSSWFMYSGWCSGPASHLYRFLHYLVFVWLITAFYVSWGRLIRWLTENIIWKVTLHTLIGCRSIELGPVCRYVQPNSTSSQNLDQSVKLCCVSQIRIKVLWLDCPFHFSTLFSCNRRPLITWLFPTWNQKTCMCCSELRSEFRSSDWSR